MSWARLHGQALARAVGRMARQPWSAATSVVVLGLAIALPLAGGVALRTAGAATAGLDTEPHVNVFLSLEAAAEDARRVEQALRASPEVASVRFVPRAEALAELKSSTHLAEILESLDRNPLPDAFTVRLKGAAGDRALPLKAEWSRLPRVDQVVADFEWSERLRAWVRLGERVVLAAAGLLALAVLFIVGHVIRLQVLTQRDEIEVSQLIGATAADVRRPFLYHGAAQALLAAGVAVGIAWVLTAWLSRELLVLTPTYATELKVVFLGPRDIAVLLGGAALLGWTGAWLAVGRELKRFSSAR